MRGGRVPGACGFGAEPERRPGSCARAQADSSTTRWGRARILLLPARGSRCREPAIAARPEGDARGGDGGGAGRGSEPSSHPRALDRRCAGRSPPGGGAARGERKAGALRDPAPVTRLTWAQRRPLRLLECGGGRGRTVRTSNSPRLLCCLLETKRGTSPGTHFPRARRGRAGWRRGSPGGGCFTEMDRVTFPSSLTLRVYYFAVIEGALFNLVSPKERPERVRVNLTTFGVPDRSDGFGQILYFLCNYSAFL